ncbi:MAG: STAS domain-containing protein [Planctomycetota bacterium]|jgi:anti-anti-sigma factor
MQNVYGPKREFDDIWVIKCTDFIDAHNADELDNVIHEAIVGGRVNLVIDFSELKYLASTGCNILFSNISKARASGGDILVYKPVGEVMEVLELLGAADLLHIISDMESAVTFFHGDEGEGGTANGDDKLTDENKKKTGVPTEDMDFDGTGIPDPIELSEFGKDKKQVPRKRRKTVYRKKSSSSRSDKEKSKKKARDKKKKKQGKKKKKNLTKKKKKS